jgi:hypothetical protein
MKLHPMHIVEINNNRDAVYKYVRDRKDTTASQCMADLQIGEKLKVYLEWLALRGHLTRVKRTIDGRRQYIYNAGLIPYVKDTVTIPTQDDVKAADLLSSVTKVYRLLDRPAPEGAKREKKASGYAGNMQSSMQTFNSW